MKIDFEIKVLAEAYPHFRGVIRSTPVSKSRTPSVFRHFSF